MEISIRDYIKVLVKWKKFIILNTFIVTIIALVISLIIPKKYTSMASLLPPLPGTGFLEVTGMTYALGLAGIPGVTTTTPADLFAAILKSRTTMNKIIEEYNLMKVYKTKFIEDAYNRLNGDTKIVVTPEQIITIAVTLRDPVLAKNIVDSYIKNLDELNKNLVMGIGKKKRIFLEKRVEEVKSNLKIVEDSLKCFQELYKTVSLEDEVKSMLEKISDIKAEIITDEVKLGVLEQYATDKNPEVIQIKNKIKELNERLSLMEKTGDKEHFGLGFSIPFQNLPSVSLELTRFTREVMIQEKLLTLLMGEYELAKAQEVKDTPTIDILEAPTVPQKKSYPKRSIIVVAAFSFSFICGVLLAFFLNWTENLKPEEKAEWGEIGAMLGKRR